MSLKQIYAAGVRSVSIKHYDVSYYVIPEIVLQIISLLFLFIHFRC